MSLPSGRCWAVVPAAGVGRRMGQDVAKQYLPLGDATVLEHSLAAILGCAVIEAVVVVLNPRDTTAQTMSCFDDKRVITAIGGEERSDSVLAGLRCLEQLGSPEDWVVVHDAARPCVSSADIGRLIEQGMATDSGAILAEPVVDTVKLADTNAEVVKTLDRGQLWRAQTPQIFRLGELQAALLDAQRRGFVVTDEASAMELVGHPVTLVAGTARNLKITLPDDLPLAAFYLGLPQTNPGVSTMRIGHGYDVHRFCDGDAVILGGVRISHSKGLEAHSDGDVLIHAICDALLGAIGEADIGHHFPDTDSAHAGIDSRLLLREVVQKVRAGGWRVANLDSTLVAQAPKMAPHIACMRDNIAADLGVTPGQVNVKATTTEGLGFTGRGEGIGAHAVVLLEAASR